MNDTVRIALDNRVYRVIRRVSDPGGRGKTAIVIPAYQPTRLAREILEVCIESIRENTPAGSYTLWVVDNNSPWENCKWLLDVPGVNLLLSRTTPVPPADRLPLVGAGKWWKKPSWGSYANAAGIELALKEMPVDCEYLLTLHMDILACRSNWLQALFDMLDENTRAAGFCFEYVRSKTGYLHVLGMLVDYRLFGRLGMDYFPDLPKYDVGDRVTDGLRVVGKTVACCENTYNNRDLESSIPVSSPYSALPVVKAFDRDGNVIFMHLGRGIPKAEKRYTGATALADEWVRFARNHILTG